MRMDKEQSFTAADVVNGYSEKQLADVIYEYGEERLSRKIAAAIVRRRVQNPYKTTSELAETVIACYPPKERYKGRALCKRTFQAIRIEVNGELDGLYEAVVAAARRLKTGGRICVITFHSLEDRIVKRAFAYLQSDCVCPPHQPICTCDKVKEIKKPPAAIISAMTQGSMKTAVKAFVSPLPTIRVTSAIISPKGSPLPTIRAATDITTTAAITVTADTITPHTTHTIMPVMRPKPQRARHIVLLMTIDITMKRLCKRRPHTTHLLTTSIPTL